MNKYPPDSFAEAFCTKGGHAFDHFEKIIMRKCFSLPTPLNLLSVLLVKLYPSYFEIDSQAIRRLALVCNRSQFQSELADLYYLQHRDREMFGHTIPIGLSLKKLMKLSSLLAE